MVIAPAQNGPRPLVSVITVCFNAQQALPGTIASLQAQSLREREWVVVDGGSRDGTLALVQQAATPPAAFVSERDAGIYDAMNKAVGLARGEWLYFLNAGDRLCDPQVLADVMHYGKQHPTLQFLIGSVVVERGELRTLKTARWINHRTLAFTDPCHQAVFARRQLFDEVGLFDLAYPTSADYDWFLRVARAGHRLQHIDRSVAFFPAGGAHAANAAALANERYRIRRRYVGGCTLTAGTLAVRIANRLSKVFRGGLPLGHKPWSPTT